MNSLIYRYSDYIKSIFPNGIRKIPVNAGFTCPTRDGSKSFGGCTYCNNDSFNPYYGQTGQSLQEQIEEGIRFFSNKYGDSDYLVYFQAYTNTYSDPENLIENYESALSVNNVKGIVVGTRPDCISNEILDYLSDISKNKYVSVEYGIESTHNKTLENVKRGHSYEDSLNAIFGTSERGINTGAHIILYLPGETEEMMLESASRISELPINTLKIHQLQIVEKTIMASQFKTDQSAFNLPTVSEYTDFMIRFLENLSPEIAVERFLSETPPSLLIAPKWGGIRLNEFIASLTKKMVERDTWQGKYRT